MNLSFCGTQTGIIKLDEWQNRNIRSQFLNASNFGGCLKEADGCIGGLNGNKLNFYIPEGNETKFMTKLESYGITNGSFIDFNA